MKSILTTIMILTGTIAFSQNVQIDTFHLKRSKSAEDIPTDKMIFPIIRSANSEIDAFINNDLKNRFTDYEYQTEDLNSALLKWADDRIVYIDFEVTYNQNGILSIHVDAEGCGIYCTTWTDYFNYSTITGKWLDFSDILFNWTEFKERVLKDKMEQLIIQREELKELLNNEETGLTETAYKGVIEDYEKCGKDTDLDAFALYPDRLEIIEECYFPHVIRSLAPYFSLKYDFTEIEDQLLLKK